MWLINAQTYYLEDFIPEKCPPYAILSHRWESQEVLFHEMADLDSAKRKAGFFKIQKTCEQALSDGVAYAWVDTCCIDKKSSAELSEAINSMFQWYKNAKVCYVFLSDVNLIDPNGEEFRSSLWFTRGWTLQELIAPKDLVFFSATWDFFGTKTGLSQHLEEVTGIQEPVLAGDLQLSRLHVASKMAWASKRETSRREDIAYCLLGIFGVNMPLLYGEGDDAFMRLQREIIRQTDDGTIFGWRSDSPRVSGLLATSPRGFRDVVANMNGWRSPHNIKFKNRVMKLTMYASLHSPLVYEVRTGCLDTVKNKSIFMYIRRSDPNSREEEATFYRIHFPDAGLEGHFSDIGFNESGKDVDTIWFNSDAALAGLIFEATPPTYHLEDGFMLQHQANLRFGLEFKPRGQFLSLFRPSPNVSRTADFEESEDGTAVYHRQYRYGKMLAFDSDHPEIESLMLGTTFDGSLVLMALSRLHPHDLAGSRKRSKAADSLLTGIPEPDSDEYLSFHSRSLGLSRMIWHRTHNAMKRLTDYPRSPFYNHFQPTDYGLWAFNPYFGDLSSRAVIALENNNLQIRVDLSSYLSYSGYYRAEIDVRRAK